MHQSTKLCTLNNGSIYTLHTITTMLFGQELNYVSMISHTDGKTGNVYDGGYKTPGHVSIVQSTQASKERVSNFEPFNQAY